MTTLKCPKPNDDVWFATATIVQVLRDKNISAEAGFKAMQNILESFHHVVILADGNVRFQRGGAPVSQKS